MKLPFPGVPIHGVNILSFGDGGVVEVFFGLCCPKRIFCTFDDSGLLQFWRALGDGLALCFSSS